MAAPLLEAWDATHAAGAVGVRHYSTDAGRTQAVYSAIAVTAA